VNGWSEGRLEQSDSSILAAHITNNLLIVTSFLAPLLSSLHSSLSSLLAQALERPIGVPGTKVQEVLKTSSLRKVELNTTIQRSSQPRLITPTLETL
jgi:hypothetical protein